MSKKKPRVWIGLGVTGYVLIVSAWRPSWNQWDCGLKSRARVSCWICEAQAEEALGRCLKPGEIVEVKVTEIPAGRPR